MKTIVMNFLNPNCLAVYILSPDSLLNIMKALFGLKVSYALQ
jgi:hypothetical protein